MKFDYSGFVHAQNNSICITIIAWNFHYFTKPASFITSHFWLFHQIFISLVYWQKLSLCMRSLPASWEKYQVFHYGFLSSLIASTSAFAEGRGFDSSSPNIAVCALSNRIALTFVPSFYSKDITAASATFCLLRTQVANFLHNLCSPSLKHSNRCGWACLQ